MLNAENLRRNVCEKNKSSFCERGGHYFLWGEVEHTVLGSEYNDPECVVQELERSQWAMENFLQNNRNKVGLLRIITSSS
jgi:hypothetical protein